MKETLIYESRKSKVYRIIDTEWEFPVLMKILNYEFPTPEDISQFYNEANIINGLDLQGIRRVLKRSKVNNRHALFLEWVEGDTIRQTFSQRNSNISFFLKIAIRIADTLSEVHGQRIIHKDINSANIIIEEGSENIKIIDFGISSKLDLKVPYIGNPELLEGTLAFNSPEQTGRVNRIVDYRTDLYSLGVVFYEILTGRLPFLASDPLELVHCHIAIVPEMPHRVNNEIPEQISKIILKLLAKNAEDRYQSAFGLCCDLKECLSLVEQFNQIPEFELGRFDFSSKFSIPQKLYGREIQIKTLLSTYDKAALGGRELLLVSGYSGTGKSALVQETHKSITRNKGWFLEGKFDQFQRGVPYFALLQAFKDFVNLVLGENESRLQTIRQSIIHALGDEGSIITEVLPNLELIIGVQQEVPQIGGAEAQNRFNYLFAKFVKAIASKDNPVVLFIDDLQWADSASLSLFKTLITDPAIQYFMFIGAYRNNETDAAHPLMTTLEDLRKIGIVPQSIELDNLSLSDVNEMIADTLFSDKISTSELTSLVYEKTRGNAFFLNQFLKALAENNLIWFDFETKKWKWDLPLIREQNITDNVVILLADKIRRLPENTQNVLKLGACIGNTFNRTMLNAVQQIDEFHEVLYAALEEGLVIPLANENYKFAHDRIQQAVYSLIPEDEKNSTHLRIGKLMLENITSEKQDEVLFEIVNQWNKGIDLVIADSEKHHLASLNLQAGRKAKQSSAFNAAFTYLNTGIQLLDVKFWTSDYQLCLNLYTDASESAYLSGNFEKMNLYIDEVLANSADLIDKVKPYETRILAFKAQNKLIEAIQTGLDLLDQLGERLPSNPNMGHVARDLLLTFWRLKGKTNDDLLSLPVMTNPYKIAAMRIIADITSSVYWAMPKLLPLIVFRMLKLTLKYGNNAVSCFAYGSYGVILCGVLGLMRKGYSYGQLSLKLLEKLNAKEWKAQIYVSPFALTNHWNEHVKFTLAPLQESYLIGLETGLIEFSCVNTNIYCIHSFLCGKPLDRLEEETRAYSESYARFKQETNYNYNEVYRQAMLNFIGKSVNPVKLKGEAFDEDKMLVQNEERNDQTGTFFIHFLKLMLCVHFREMEAAIFHAAEARKLLEAVLAKFEIPNHHFYEALAMISLYPNSTPENKSKYASRIRKNISSLKKWAKTAPENFLHKQLLMEAEWLSVNDKKMKARAFYDKAISHSTTQEFTHETALAYEMAGRFYINEGSHELASFFLKSAYNAYREWGAIAKLNNLEQNLPKYVSGLQRMSTGVSASVDTDSVLIHGSVLDLNTVLKASTSISGEIVLPKLLKKLMGIVIENAGAQRGVLLLRTDEGLMVEIESDVDRIHENVMQHTPVAQFERLSHPIVQYVNRSGESVVVNNAQTDVRYSADQYLIKSGIKSAICLPIIHQGKSAGVLYLENNLITGAFTQDRIELLTLLSGQIAVSIDNAMLYESLEQKVEERTAELAKEKQKSDDLLLNILPLETANELKHNGKTAPKRFEKVTVMFTDFKGFTELSEKMDPEELVEQIDTIFKGFDEIIEKNGIEKIKTVGDAYLCAGGLPVASENHAEAVVNAAIEIRDFVEKYIDDRKKIGKTFFEIRIGIHSGPVVAGVVGRKKFAYDIWGDTVNTASRMESSCEVGRVNVSTTTYELLQDKFEFEYRGEIEAKGKGKIGMYFVNGSK